DLSAAPAKVRRLLDKCLEKDPRRRLRDISDFELLLDGETAATASSAPRFSLWPWLAAGIGLAAAAVFAVLWMRQPQPEYQKVKFPLDAPSDVLFVNQYGAFSVSPDGRYVAFSGRPKDASSASLWLRSLDSTEARM